MLRVRGLGGVLRRLKAEVTRAAIAQVRPSERPQGPETSTHDRTRTQ